MMPSATAEHPRDSVLDAIAVLLSLNRADLESANLLLATYADDPQTLLNAITAVALCAVRYSALAADKSAEELLAGVVQQIREQA